MTTAIFTTAPTVSLPRFLKNVGTAVRAFAEALFAAQGRQFAAQEVRTAQAASARDVAKGRRQLYSLASQYDSVAPSLSAELRSIAARG